MKPDYERMLIELEAEYREYLDEHEGLKRALAASLGTAAEPGARVAVIESTRRLASVNADLSNVHGMLLRSQMKELNDEG